MKGSRIASKIDNEYRREKMFELKKRAKCKEKEYGKCAYNVICENRKDLEE